MDNILEVIKNSKLDYKQKRQQLALEAENLLPYVKISDEATQYLKAGVICDLFEGHAPYRPRYILPDYKKFMANGSAYLNIDSPKDFYEAINALLILYEFIPSITTYPVFLGELDELLEPFVDTVSEKEFHNLMKMFLIHIDRTLPDAFVHADLGPKNSRVACKVLELEMELEKAVPNISLKCDEDTPESLLELAVKTTLKVGKPYFINHKELTQAIGTDYAIASCYNSLLKGGGSYTLVRINLKSASALAKDYPNFLNVVLKDVVKKQCEIINSRAKFIVEDAKFFESSFLNREGLISINKFTSMAGIFGLYECVENLSGGLKMGTDHNIHIIKDGD